VKGPAVWTVIVTVSGEFVVALIWVGLKEQVAPVGSPAEHVYVTLLPNVPAPTAEIDMVVEADCPGLAAGGAARDAGTVKSGSVTVTTAGVVVVDGML